MLTVRVPSWILQAPDLLRRRHFRWAFLGAVALRTQIRFCELILQVVDEQQGRFLMREFPIRHFRSVQSTYSYTALPSRRTSTSCKIGSRRDRHWPRPDHGSARSHTLQLQVGSPMIEPNQRSMVKCDGCLSPTLCCMIAFMPDHVNGLKMLGVARRSKLLGFNGLDRSFLAAHCYAGKLTDGTCLEATHHWS
jgi:hypothetical protein